VWHVARVELERDWSYHVVRFENYVGKDSLEDPDVNRSVQIRLLFEKGTRNFSVGRYSSVGLATGLGLDDPGIESWWGRDFPHPSRPGMWLTHPPIQWVPGHSRGKAAGA
jgi:hypothetical protein